MDFLHCFTCCVSLDYFIHVCVHSSIFFIWSPCVRWFITLLSVVADYFMLSFQLTAWVKVDHSTCCLLLRSFFLLKPFAFHRFFNQYKFSHVFILIHLFVRHLVQVHLWLLDSCMNMMFGGLIDWLIDSFIIFFAWINSFIHWCRCCARCQRCARDTMGWPRKCSRRLRRMLPRTFLLRCCFITYLFLCISRCTFFVATSDFPDQVLFHRICNFLSVFRCTFFRLGAPFLCLPRTVLLKCCFTPGTFFCVFLYISGAPSIVCFCIQVGVSFLCVTSDMLSHGRAVLFSIILLLLSLININQLLFLSMLHNSYDTHDKMWLDSISCRCRRWPPPCYPGSTRPFCPQVKLKLKLKLNRKTRRRRRRRKKSVIVFLRYWGFLRGWCIVTSAKRRLIGRLIVWLFVFLPMQNTTLNSLYVIAAGCWDCHVNTACMSRADDSHSATPPIYFMQQTVWRFLLPYLTHADAAIDATSAPPVFCFFCCFCFFCPLCVVHMFVLMLMLMLIVKVRVAKASFCSPCW